MGNKANLLIIGAQKAGTTSLYEYIRQHPDIYFSEVKEVTYFVDDDLYAKGETYYSSFFSRYQSEKVIASADVHMLPCMKCPERVKKYNPKMKFIVMLREPVERAYSAYNYAIKNGWEQAEHSFISTMKLEAERVRGEEYNLTYFENGLYHKHLIHWQKFFGQDQFLIIRDVDLKEDADSVLKKVYDFLEVSYVQVDTSKEYNKAGYVKSRKLQNFLLNKQSRLKKYLGILLPVKLKVLIRSRLFKKIYSYNQVNQENSPLKEEDALLLREYYESDLKKLSSFYGIKFNGK